MRAKTTVSLLGISESSKASSAMYPGDLLASRSPTTSLQARLEWRTISMLCEKSGSQSAVCKRRGMSQPRPNTDEVDLGSTRS